MEKQALRGKVLSQLRAFPSDEKQAASARIREHLLAWPAFQAAHTILLYAALPSEPDLMPLLELSKRFIFPKVAPHGLTLHHIAEVGQLPYVGKLREPAAGLPEVSYGEIQLALVPGLAFSHAGSRLGRGGGYYDRLLSDATFRATAVGVCFQLQLQASLPTEPHDCSVQSVITEEGIIDCP